MLPKNNNITHDNDNNRPEEIVGLKKNSALTKIETDYSYKHKIVWENAMILLFLHLLALWGLLIFATGSINYKTYIWTVLILFCSSEGLTIGAHRLFSHKSFKATPFLKASLIILQTISGQGSVYLWCRDHRLHHRYSDTDGDPHNPKRGFFFSHVGWLMYKKHPYVTELGRGIDMSDLQADWMIMFQKKYYYYLYFLFTIFIPVVVPYYYFGESFKNSFLVCFFLRYVYQLNGTWLINSANHRYGARPYDKKMQPTELWLTSFITYGEGWHNYHHAFPWDYKTAELTTFLNLSAIIIRILEKLGLAYDLKTAPPEMIARRIIKTGYGTNYALGNKKYRNTVDAFSLLDHFSPILQCHDDATGDILDDEELILYYENDKIDLDVLKINNVAS